MNIVSLLIGFIVGAALEAEAQQLGKDVSDYLARTGK